MHGSGQGSFNGIYDDLMIVMIALYTAFAIHILHIFYRTRHADMHAIFKTRVNL